MVSGHLTMNSFSSFMTYGLPESQPVGLSGSPLACEPPADSSASASSPSSSSSPFFVQPRMKARTNTAMPPRVTTIA